MVQHFTFSGRSLAVSSAPSSRALKPLHLTAVFNHILPLLKKTLSVVTSLKALSVCDDLGRCQTQFLPLAGRAARLFDEWHCVIRNPTGEVYESDGA
jgi:hypothetical protein